MILNRISSAIRSGVGEERYFRDNKLKTELERRRRDKENESILQINQFLIN